ncbi:glycosyltransferase family 4 protein [Olivibacter domesticus]|uniref:Glycosyltransferase involved in cell wall bisynthesis n=1 Tax=Olivibacter domesticus TaxID=407022 RepID=A0A1H7YX57_OLID1|nr:glycosyltransferase family 1 protein [Olivibacter domesticus]SEM50555.1 Glycosyltransferase involved in cell wall bisynthesis [Olivibacter domesticus]
MTIYINGKFLSQRITGVQRYGLEITKALIDQGANVKVIIPSYLEVSKVDLPSNLLISIGNTKNSIIWEQISLPNYLKNKKEYVLLSLCNIGTLFNKNQLICVHDVAFLKKEKWFKWSFRQYYKFMIPKLVAGSRGVITVSEFSKKEISEKLSVNLSEISVIYNAPADQFMSSQFYELQNEKSDYFLFVGSRDPRKNLHLLLGLFALKEFDKQRLIVVGGNSKSFNQMDLVDLPNVEFKSGCNDKELAHLYRSAKALINPSLYEGFGLPLIEAMASGCALILSDIEVFKEVVGKGATYFDPSSIDSISVAMRNFLKLPEETKKQQIQQNYIRSKDFTWEKSSRKLLDFINSI